MFSIVLPVLICDDPPQFKNSSYHPQRWLNGTQANYTCDSGYKFAADSSHNLTCEVRGYDVQWSEETIKCVPGIEAFKMYNACPLFVSTP